MDFTNDAELYTGTTSRSNKMAGPARLTVLISGNGTNLQAVIDSINAADLPAQVIRVISNRKNAFGLERAQRANIPTHYHNLVKYKKQHPATPDGVQAAREEYDAELARLVLQDGPDLVVCLGFMHVVSEKFLGPLKEKELGIVNLHPALPGAFNGTVSASSPSHLRDGNEVMLMLMDDDVQNAIQRAHAAWLEGRIDKTGVMIHHVISEVDMGKPILVREIPFVKGADEDLGAFEDKVHEVEWGAVIEGLQIAIDELKRTESSA